MGAPSGCLALAWALAALLLVQKSETQGGVQPSWASTEAAANSPRVDAAWSVTVIPPITILPTMSFLNPAHNGRVCSTWGDFHYKTFDGDIFRFPGLCNYVFSAHCGAAYEDFNIQLRRGLAGSRPIITHVVLKTQGLVLEASNGSVLINGQREELPYSRAGLLVEQSSVYLKVTVRLGLTFLWNREDSALLELDPKYANQTCGLCGDFNGLPAVNEFYSHNARLTPLQFGNLQKLDGPTEQCQDPPPSPANNCTDREGVCRRTLLGRAFAECNALVDPTEYVAACTQDLCRCPTCPCATFAEYSRQCAHAGGRPQNWRGPDLCPQTCPLNMQHQECGLPCADTCSNPERSQLCEDHCVDGCFCPPGTVLDDVTHGGCLPLERCPCTHGGHTYAPGASFTTSCSSCTCSGGLWQCQDLPCPGTCSVQGGSHISTYDERLYDVHGDCSYVLSKKCTGDLFTVLAELRTCGLTDNENCLKSVALSMNGGDTIIQIQANGGVFINSIYTQLPVSAANITVFRPTSFFILVHTGLGLQLQVQLVPLMQVFLRLDPSYQGQMCGLCGNFNQNQADDFRALSGVVEGTAAAFANTWKTQAACPNVKNSFEDPCSLSVENENYARHWCSLLTDPAGAFSRCHSILNPAPFHSNCMFDTCNCEKSEDCLCAALSSYVHACATKGVLLSGWRDGVCTKYMSSCPKSQNYTYVVDSCQPTCRALSQVDVTCGVPFVPVDGCVCPSGTFLDDAGACVSAEACPCYFHSSVVAPGEVVHDNGVVCSCAGGKLSCLGAAEQKSSGCTAPMVYLDCNNASAGTPGAECLRSCHTLDVDCFSTHCVSGCVCPPGLVSDGSGGCVAEEDCPCLHNEAAYKPGETIRVACNTCTCRNRRWECSHKPCLGTCVAYGDGHFITFDGERYSFEGSCEYTLAQDHCGGNGTANGTFRVVTENVPCGTTGVTCSKAIKLFLENYELILHEGTYKVVQRGPGRGLPYKVRYTGIYLTVETQSGVLLSWDRKTSVFIRLRQDYKGRVCGLCGNFDDKGVNDFTTRSQSVVGSALEFGNSWKFSPSCPDAPAPRDPCTANPYRKSWSQKQCSIINSATFASCHSQVDPTKYYEACVGDACACDLGGDCECLCTAVAAYAQACRDVGVCVSWRTPDICPLFCDYYNREGQCEWHYQPCGAPCMRTCRNPSGRCQMDLPGLEGCYPRCPPSEPFFSEDQMKCVAQCGCYDEDGNYHDVGARVPAAENCQSCECTAGGLRCTHSLEACTCVYEGQTYHYEDVIYNTTDGLGACLIAICGPEGRIIRRTMECPGTPSTTPFTFTTTAAPLSTTGSGTTFPTVCVRERCLWSDWYDSGRPEPGMAGGDFETFGNLRQSGHQVCPAPASIECRAQGLPDTPLQQLGQKVECDVAQGLTCLNAEQSPPLCHNYEVRVLCCDYVPCGISPSTTSLQTPTESLPTPRTQTPPAEPTTTGTWAPSSSATLATTSCQPRCQWTEWFDEDYPKSEEAGGDIESYDRIRSAGGAVCEQPQDIECQAENFPGRSPESLGQRVHCDASFGLVCRNQEQVGLFKMCYNYRIRVFCCSHDHCKQPTPQPLTQTPPLRTTGGPSSGPTPVSGTTQILMTPTTGTVSTGPPSTSHTEIHTTRAKTSLETLVTATTEATSSQGTTSCQPQCEWTDWFDVDFPTSGVEGGDMETFENIRIAGGTLCQEPQRIQCRAENYPEVSIDQIGQVLTCSLHTGLICRNQDQKGPFNMCFNYNVRVLCCHPSPHCPSTAAPSTVALSTAAPSTASTTPSIQTRASSPEATSTAPSPAPQTARTLVTPTTMATTIFPSMPITRVSTGSPRSSESPTWHPKTSPGQPITLPGTAQATSSTGPGTRASPSPPTIQATSSPWSTTIRLSAGTSRATAPTGKTQTSLLVTSSHTQSPTSPVAMSTACEPRCAWTDWIDESYPTPGVSGGEFETYTNIRADGKAICKQPLDLQCHAVTLPGNTLETLGQVVHCGLPEGLVCRNQDQDDRFKMCFNYKIRVLCCEDYSHCASTLATTVVSPWGTSPGLTPTLATSTTVQPSMTPSPMAPSTVATSTCQPTCHWTKWMDSDQPLPGRYGGDIETYYHIQDAGGQLCEEPEAIECQAVLYPDTPLEQLDQVVYCDVSYGLICRNNRQRGGQPCLNYHIRVLCCEEDSNCVSSPRPQPTTTSTGISTSISTSTSQRSPEVTGLKSRATHPSSPRTTQRVPTSTTQTFLSSFGTTEGVTVSTSQTGPSSPQTSHRVTASTTQTGPSTPGTSQGVTASTIQKGPSSAVTSQGVTTSTIQTGPSSPGTSQRVTSSTTQTGPSSPGTSQRVTSSTTQTGPSSPGTSQGLTASTTQTGPSSPGTSQRVSVSTTQTLPTPARTTERVSSLGPSASPRLPTTITKPTSPSAPTSGPVVTSNRWVSSKSPPSTSTFGTTLVSRPPQPSSSTHTLATSSSTGCSPRCTWTDWFDEDYPTPGLDGGDFETFSVFRSAGLSFCQHPQDIQCRSEKAPDTRLEDLGQVVRCNVSFGLVCRNREQPGPLRYCHNYHVRLLCCEDNGHCPSATTTSTAPSTSPAVFSTTSSTGQSSPGVTKLQTTATLPSSPRTNQRVPTSTTQTFPSSFGTTEGITVSTTQTGPSSPGTTKKVTVSTIQTVPSSPETTKGVTVSTTQTGPSSPGTTKKVTVSTIQTVPTSPETTQGVTTSTTQTAASSTGITKRVLVSTIQTGPSSPGTSQGVTMSTTQTGPSSSGTTEKITVSTIQTVPSSPETTQEVTTSTTQRAASSTGITKRVLVSTTQTGPSSSGTSQGVTMSTTQTGPSSSGTTEKVTVSTTQTVPSSPGTTQGVTVSTTQTGPSSPGITKKVLVSTTQTGPSSPVTTEKATVSTIQTVPSSPETTQGVTVSTIQTGTSSTGITKRALVSTTQTGPSSPGTSQGVTMSTIKTGPSSPGTTQGVTVSTTQTGPSSPGITKKVLVSTTQTGPSSPGTSQKVTASTTQTGSASPRSTQGVTVSTIQTGPSSPQITKRVLISTTETGPSSPVTSQRITASTTQTGPSSPGTTEKATVSTIQTVPSSPETTQGVTVSTTQTGTSSPGSTQGTTVSTTQTGPSSPGTTEKATASTTQTGPSSPGITKKVLISTIQTGPSSPVTSQGVATSTTQTGPSSPGTSQRLTASTTQTGPSSPGTSQGVTASTIQTGPSSPATSQGVATSTTQTGPSSPGTSQRLTVSTTQTGPSSPGTSQRVSVSTTQTLPTPARTTERVSSLGPSASPRLPTTITKPTSPSAPTSGPVVTSSRWISSKSPPSTSTFGTTLVSRPPQPSSSTHTLATSSSTGCSPRCTWTDWFDEDYPVPGLDGGDFETFSVFRSAGLSFCQHPQDIQCRSEKAPDTRLEDLGQVVRCNVSFGLVCRNREQPGPLRYCHNYHVRLLCCEDNGHCPSATTTSTAPSTSPAVFSTTSSTGQSSPGVTKLQTTATLPSSPRTNQRVPTSTTQTFPSSFGTTEGITVSTTQTGPSSPRTTKKVTVSTIQTVPSSPGIIEKVTASTTQTGPSSPGTTHEVTVSTIQTGPSSSGITKRVLVSTIKTSPSSPGTSQRITASTTQTGPSSPGTTHGVTESTNQTGPSSPVTTKSVLVSTTQTGLSSPGTSKRVTASTTQTGPSSSGSTQGTTVSTTQTGSSSTASTIQTGPSSPRTSQGVTMSTTQTGPSSPKTTEKATVSTIQTGPSSPGTSQGITASTTQTGPSSPGTTEKATVSTIQTGPSSPGTSQGITASTTQTGPSSPGTSQGITVSTTQTGPSSPGTTEKATVSTIQTGPSSPGTSQGFTASTTQTGASSPGTTEKATVSTTQTGPSSPVTTQEITVSTTHTGPSSPQITKRVLISTTQTGPSSPGTSQRLTASTTQTGTSSPRTTGKATVSTTQTGPSSPGTSQRVTVSTTQTGPSSPGTSQGVATSTTQTGPSSPATSQGVATSTTQTGPSSPGTSQRVSVSTTQTLPTPARTTERVSSLGPSASPRLPTTITKPTSPSAPTSGPVVTSSRWISSKSPPSTSTFGTTLVSRPPQPSSSTHTLATSSSTGCSPRCTWTDWFDEDYPVPGLDGGDFETFSVFRSAGLSFCQHPQDIQCRSEKAPDTRLEDLGQVVRCNVSFGLVCRNREQPGPLRYCHNYHVRLLCCEDNGHCLPATTTSMASSSAPQTSRTPVTLTTRATTVFPSVPIFHISTVSTGRPRSSESPTWHPGTSPGQPSTLPSTAQAISSSGASTRASLSPPTPEATSSLWSTVLLSAASSLSPETTHILPPVTMSTVSSAVLTTPRPASSPSSHFTTGCLCQAFGQLFSPGDVVYNKTDRAGCHFYAICNQRCDIDRFQGTCPTTSPPESSSSASTSPTSPAPVCDLIVPPRQVNESWTLSDCTRARCEGDNHVILLGRKPVPSIHCVNGHQPVKVWSENDPCDFYFECECSCRGWGDSHYTTFDGTSYSFLDNCTHVLMKEIHPRHGNLSIHMNNYYCRAPAATAHCPRALSIHYKSTEVILTISIDASGQEQSLILFDQIQVSSGFSKNGMSVSVTGTTTMGIDIPAIGVNITFDGHLFQIRLSYSHFSHNTEGQCGTCTNNQNDDCRQPDGTMAPSCQHMALSWLVPESNREDCWAPTSPPPTAGTLPSAPTTPTSTPCPPAPLCELILSPVFAECHDLIPPGPFVSSCVSDSCQPDRPQVLCQSLEAYAALCRARGVCSSWRNATDGLCNFTCPPDKVYQPCGPAQPASCDLRSQSRAGRGLAEGCFCPDGHTLFNTHTNICVRECACVGPDGFPKSPGERWVSDCQDCMCHPGSMSVQCTPLLCEAQDPPLQCSGAGFVAITRPLGNNSCCLETLCVCNTTTCTQSPPTCGPAEELVRTQKEDACCPTFSCRPQLCFYNHTFFGVGATFPSVTPCHTCTCLSMDTRGPIVQCEENTCNTTCRQGYEHRKVAGQCCGECVQTACPTSDGWLIQPNETWVNPLLDNCTEYRCEVQNGLHVLTQRPTPCPVVSSCEGILRKIGCCYSCEEVDKCQVRVNTTVLTHQGCATHAPVNVTFCEGSCPGVSKYSMEAQAIEHQCTCCQETVVHEEVVTMQCPDGTAVQHTYTHVDKCSCAPSCGPSPKAPEDSTPVFPV
ncbi:mucin-5B [Vulpes lagopus]|uniref:mucin-5B n=1 Tax=Vulpes lagopus TaxID=494514 RepID=UPI001BC95BE5|nr:mucin-5B [Vulpes lagopus]